MPKVSVLMAVYNGERYLRQAVDSILGQTFTDFEFIAVDDGSSDASAEILESYGDGRLRMLRQPENQGLAKSLILGQAAASGEYVARMDADDISHPRRLESQVEHLDANPDVGLLGAWVERIDGNGASLGLRRLPTSPGRLRWSLLFGNPIPHSAVMFRKALVDSIGGYDPAWLRAQDYELWSRLVWETELAQLPMPLLLSRRHSASVSANLNDFLWRGSDTITQRYAERLLVSTVPLDLIRQRRLAFQRDLRLDDQATRLIADHLWALHGAFAHRWDLSPMDRLWVRLDLARKLLILAGQGSERPPATVAAFLGMAFRADPRIAATRPFWQYMGSVVRGAPTGQ